MQGELWPLGLLGCCGRRLLNERRQRGLSRDPSRQIAPEPGENAVLVPVLVFRAVTRSSGGIGPVRERVALAGVGVYELSIKRADSVVNECEMKNARRLAEKNEAGQDRRSAAHILGLPRSSADHRSLAPRVRLVLVLVSRRVNPV
jgi:hypothetical protein